MEMKEERTNLKINQYKLSNLKNERGGVFFNEKCIRNLLENTKRYNIHVIGIPEKEEKGNET